jgi:hypothetical protein
MRPEKSSTLLAAALQNKTGMVLFPFRVGIARSAGRGPPAAVGRALLDGRSSRVAGGASRPVGVFFGLDAWRRRVRNDRPGGLWLRPASFLVSHAISQLMTEAGRAG